MKHKKYYLVSYRERSGEEEHDGKFLILTAQNPETAVEQVLSEFWGGDAKNMGGSYWRSDGCAVVDERGIQDISHADAKVLMKHGTNLLYGGK